MPKYKVPSIKELFESGVHLGHQVRRWNPKMEPFIYTVRKESHIIDLEKTEKGLDAACRFLYEIAKKGEQIVFVGTKKQASELVELEAKRCGALYVTQRWLGGTLTNYRIIKKRIDGLVDLMKRREAGALAKYTKKERLLFDREIEKLQGSIGGLVGFQNRPGAFFVIDTKREKTAVSEAVKRGVPVVALVDTNSDPTGISYLIPGNDDAIKSVVLILRAISDAVEDGYKEYTQSKDKEKEEEEEVKEGVEAEVPKEENKKEGKKVSKPAKKRGGSKKVESKKEEK